MTDERRRAPRETMHTGTTAGLRQSASVQILDLTVAGLLFQSNYPVPVGTRGSLRLTLEGEAITTDVAVVRVAPVLTGTEMRYQIGAQFVGLTPETQRILERVTHH